MRALLAFVAIVAAAPAVPDSRAASPVAHIDAGEVAAAFAKGMPLVETDGYKVHASRRDAAGLAEVHARDTDILYVLEGSATVVTGGDVVDGKTSGPGEIRGRSIRGGETRRLAKGDVMIVPSGTPHWFREVQGPLLYYVVKVTSVEGGAR